MSHAAAIEPMRRAFAMRLHEVVDHLARAADLATIEEVLSMADPFSGLGKASLTSEAADPRPLARLGCGACRLGTG